MMKPYNHNRTRVVFTAVQCVIVRYLCVSGSIILHSTVITIFVFNDFVQCFYLMILLDEIATISSKLFL